jgi:uncharacterized membrane protein YjjP (DUF1212 family)
VETKENHYNAWLHGYAIFIACATFLLIIAGGARNLE